MIWGEESNLLINGHYMASNERNDKFEIDKKNLLLNNEICFGLYLVERT